MENEFSYMLGVIGIGCGITLLMRAIPFLLFAGRDRKLPDWVTRFGSFISPVIIAALIVYSYWGLKIGADPSAQVRACETPWPYIAGGVTVALHLLLRNPLVSILAGTILFMVLITLCGGCASVPIETVRSTPQHPLLHITRTCILYRDQPVRPDEVPKRLEKDNVSQKEVLHVLVDPDFTDQRTLWVFKHDYLDRYGYTRAIMMNGEMRAVSGDSSLRESFEQKGRIVPYEGHSRPTINRPVIRKGPPSWQK